MVRAVLLALLLSEVGVWACAADVVVLGRKGERPAIVTCTADTPVISVARSRLATYLKALAAAEPQLKITPEGSSRAILLGDSSLAQRYRLVPPEAGREESYLVWPVESGKQSLLIVSGQSDRGIKQGIFHILRHLELADDGRLLLERAQVRSSPAIKLRVSHIGGVTHQAFDRQTGRRLPHPIPATPQQLDWNHVNRWEPQRIGPYIDLLDFMGYNGIEEPPTLYEPDEQDAESIARRKIIREHILANGMTAFAKIDGTLGDSGAVPYGSDSKSRYDQYYRQMAETAAPYNDIVLTHWVDGGGWKGTPDHPCTIELLQELHMQIDEQFKRVNPAIRSVLSLWNLHNPAYQRWLGYKGVEAILGSGKIPADVGIAMSRMYKSDEAAKITAAGHSAGVWGWYLADQELIYTMHVHTHRLKDYFGGLPPKAADVMSFHVLDNNQRETNLYTIYIGARMMWDPHGDPEVYLREISRLVYGRRLEEPVFRGLKAIADIRCGNLQCRGCWSPLRDQSNEIVTFEQAYRQASDAWEGIKNIQNDEAYVPPIQFHQPPATLLEELKGHVQAVACYMQFLKDKRDGRASLTEVPPAPGPFEYYERFRYLQERKDSSGGP